LFSFFPFCLCLLVQWSPLIHGCTSAVLHISVPQQNDARCRRLPLCLPVSPPPPAPLPLV
jgi:hypothetical protein